MVDKLAHILQKNVLFLFLYNYAVTKHIFVIKRIIKAKKWFNYRYVVLLFENAKNLVWLDDTKQKKKSGLCAKTKKILPSSVSSFFKKIPNWTPLIWHLPCGPTPPGATLLFGIYGDMPPVYTEYGFLALLS